MLYAQLRGLPYGLAHAIALGDTLHQGEVGEFFDGQLADAARECLLAVQGDDLDFPALAARRAAGDVLARFYAAHNHVAALFFTHGQRDHIAFRHDVVHEKPGHRHGASHLSGLRVQRGAAAFRAEFSLL